MGKERNIRKLNIVLCGILLYYIVKYSADYEYPL